ELTLAEFTSHQPGLISTLVSIAIINSAAEELRARLVSDSLPTQVCQPMIERINRLALAPTTKILESELLMTRALFGRHFDETGQIPEAIRPELAATLHAA